MPDYVNVISNDSMPIHEVGMNWLLEASRTPNSLSMGATGVQLVLEATSVLCTLETVYQCIDSLNSVWKLSEIRFDVISPFDVVHDLVDVNALVNCVDAIPFPLFLVLLGASAEVLDVLADFLVQPMGMLLPRRDIWIVSKSDPFG